MKSKKHMLLSLAFATLMGAGAAHAEPLSEQPVRLLVSFAPGGTADILARGLAEAITRTTGQTVVVENRPGAGGAIAVGALSRSKPDGLTLLLHSTGAVIGPYIQKEPPYDPATAFDIVSPVASGPFVLLVSQSSPANNATEFLELAKAATPEFTYGTGGVGSTGHLTGESVQLITGTPLTHVAFKGGNPAMTAVAGDQVQFVFEPIASSRPFVEGKRLKPLAVTSGKRSPIWPDLPTLDESGVTGLDVNIWYAAFLPPGASQEVKTYWNETITRALRDEGIQKWIHDQGFEPTPLSSEAASQFLKDENEKWKSVVEQSGVVLE